MYTAILRDTKFMNIRLTNIQSYELTSIKPSIYIENLSYIYRFVIMNGQTTSKHCAHSAVHRLEEEGQPNVVLYCTVLY